MSIENPAERLERTEAYLKQRLSDYKDVMPIKGGNEATLLKIYGEWMDYLVKENLKNRSDLIKKWERFLLERNTDAIADLLIGFFEAKRRYGRDIERGEDKWDWFALCKNYCKKNGWNEDEDLLHSLFSSYSGAERRISRKIEEGRVLADTSKSILEIMDLTQAEMDRKEEERKRKTEERLAEQAEKQKRKEEREKIKEEKRKRKTEEKLAEQAERQKRKEKQEGKEEKSDEKSKESEKLGEETSDLIDEGAENHYGGNDRDVVDENGDVVPNPKHVYKVEEEGMASNSEDENFDNKEIENKRRNKKKKSVPQQLEFQFGGEDGE